MGNYRKLHFGTEIWTYKIYLYDIEVRDPQRKKHMIKIHKMLGVSPTVVEDEALDKCIHITPSQIKKYITKHFKGVENVGSK